MIIVCVPCLNKIEYLKKDTKVSDAFGFYYFNHYNINNCKAFKEFSSWKDLLNHNDWIVKVKFNDINM